MTAPVLTVTGDVAGDALRVSAGTGDWVAVACTTSEEVVAEIAGVTGRVRVTVAGQDLPARDPAARRQARLSVVASRVPAVPGWRVMDLLQLAAAGQEASLWQPLTPVHRSAKGLPQRCRATAGRVGLSRWLDVGLNRLPPAVAALTDLTRGLLESPVALVWRRPDWLDPEDVAVLTDVLLSEQHGRGLCVVEVLQRRDAAFDGTFDAGENGGDDRSA